jgi:hypothetical protein
MSHDDFDENYAMPPVRVHTGDELPKRIAQGIADRWGAGAVRGLMAWCDQYERALCWIATHGDAQSAMLACKAIVGRADECIESMHIAALTGAEGVQAEGTVMQQTGD